MMAIAANPPNRQFAVEVSTFLALAIALVLIRFLLRVQAVGLWRLRLDDWGMQIAVVLFVFTTTCAHSIAQSSKIGPGVYPNHFPIALSPGLANDGMTDAYRASLAPASLEYQLRVVGSKLHLTASSLYSTTLWWLKLCIAIYYTHLTDGLVHMKIRVLTAHLAIAITYLMVMVTMLGSCQPFNHHWQINPNPGDQCMPAVSVVSNYVLVVFNVLTDLYLLHIPLLMIWNAQISRIQKLPPIIISSGGVFVMIAAIMRAHFILTAGRERGQDAAHWGTRELFVALVISNAPVIYGEVNIWLRRRRGEGVMEKAKGWRLGLDRISPKWFSWVTAFGGNRQNGHNHPDLKLSHVSSRADAHTVSELDSPVPAIPLPVKYDKSSLRGCDSYPSTIGLARYTLADSEAPLNTQSFTLEVLASLSSLSWVDLQGAGEVAGLPLGTPETVIHRPSPAKQKAICDDT